MSPIRGLHSKALKKNRNSTESQHSYDFGRVPANYCARGHVFNDYRTSSNNRTLANSYSVTDSDVTTDIHIRFDQYRLGLMFV